MNIAFVLIAFFALSIGAFAAEEKKGFTFGGFLDTYYGFDFSEPSGDRSFTTQAVRHNEFSINLAYVDVRLDREKVRGRLAFQAGSSVYSNYSGERRYGPAGGPQLADALTHDRVHRTLRLLVDDALGPSSDGGHF